MCFGWIAKTLLQKTEWVWKNIKWWMNEFSSVNRNDNKKCRELCSLFFFACQQTKSVFTVSSYYEVSFAQNNKLSSLNPSYLNDATKWSETNKMTSTKDKTIKCLITEWFQSFTVITLLFSFIKLLTTIYELASMPNFFYFRITFNLIWHTQTHTHTHTHTARVLIF